MKKLALLALAAFVGACDDGPGPVPVAEVEIRLNAASVDERSIEIGETVQLTATLRDGNGGALTGRAVTWTSSVPSVATVNADGLVTGVGAGETIVKATSEGISDEVVIIVQAPAAPLTCADGDAGISLGVGEAHQTDAQASQVLCVAGGATGAEYVLVPFNSAASAANLLNVEVAGSGLVAAVGPPSPALFSQSTTGVAGTEVPRLREDLEFHRELRERERREIGPLRRSGGTELRPMLSQGPSYATASVGDILTLNVNADDGCSNPRWRGAEVMAVSTHAVVVADTTNPSGGFTQAEYAHFATTFDTLVYPTITSNFGVPSDIDDNGGRSIILFTKAVNALTSPGSTSYVGGFFYSRDLFPRTATETMGACATSNEAEMFYMLVPDPNGEVNNNERSKAFVQERTVGVLAHEFQHLINASRRLFVIQAGGSSWVEETWLNEGLSHIAEELTFYAATSLAPKQNIGIDELRNDSRTFDMFVQYQWSNFGRYIEYLKNPPAQSPLGLSADDSDLATRGAIWSFLRYAADRQTTAEATLWRAMVDSDRTGIANLNAVLSNNTLAWMRDWANSVYTDDALSTNAFYQQPSWNFREILTSLKNGTTGQLLYPTFPLRVVQLGNGAANEQEMQLQGGTANYLRFGVPPASRGAVRATSGGLTAPSRLKLTLVRTK